MDAGVFVGRGSGVSRTTFRRVAVITVESLSPDVLLGVGLLATKSVAVD